MTASRQTNTTIEERRGEERRAMQQSSMTTIALLANYTTYLTHNEHLSEAIYSGSDDIQKMVNS